MYPLQYWVSPGREKTDSSLEAREEPAVVRIDFCSLISWAKSAPPNCWKTLNIVNLGASHAATRDRQRHTQAQTDVRYEVTALDFDQYHAETRSAFLSKLHVVCRKARQLPPILRP